jgi:hypothetical protein
MKQRVLLTLFVFILSLSSFGVAYARESKEREPALLQAFSTSTGTVLKEAIGGKITDQSADVGLHEVKHSFGGDRVSGAVFDEVEHSSGNGQGSDVLFSEVKRPSDNK